ncbi:MAG: hypothetical protein LBP92_02650 [Deltaproteobacteria bacterium]|nr:hypothetical protein [Deltaproteobacteria bacterium]
MAASPGDLDGLATSAAGLAPFGPGNPAPVVALHAARVCHAATASAGAGRHLKMIIYVGRGQRLTVVGFDLGHRLDECEIEMDLILHLEFSTRTGLPTPYWRLLDFKPSETL